MTRKLLALLLLPPALVAAGCGEKEEPTGGAPPRERLTLVLDYFPNADHAPIYAAQGEGFFEQVGLDVEIQTPSDPAAPLKLVTAGRADVAISYEPEVLLARDKGAEVASIGALVQAPLTSIVALPGSRVRRVEDLEGKKVGTAGIPYQSAYLKTVLRQAGVDPSSVEEVNVGFNLVPAMLSKRVDATLGSFWNYEGTQLQREGRRPTILRLERLGVPTYDELVLVAAEDRLGERGAVFRRFLQALRRGAEAVREDPETGIRPLLRANRDLEAGLQRAVVEKTVDLFFPEDEDRPYGWQDPVAWERYGRWMLDNGLLTKPAEPNALSNEFLPGGGI
jgi:putative hydroxymethylpyrimidine transport system substrate-binding protein